MRRRNPQPLLVLGNPGSGERFNLLDSADTRGIEMFVGALPSSMPTARVKREIRKRLKGRAPRAAIKQAMEYAALVHKGRGRRETGEIEALYRGPARTRNCGCPSRRNPHVHSSPEGDYVDAYSDERLASRSIRVHDRGERECNPWSLQYQVGNTRYDRGWPEAKRGAYEEGVKRLKRMGVPYEAGWVSPRGLSARQHRHTLLKSLHGQKYIDADPLRDLNPQLPEERPGEDNESRLEFAMRTGWLQSFPEKAEDASEIAEQRNQLHAAGVTTEIGQDGSLWVYVGPVAEYGEGEAGIKGWQQAMNYVAETVSGRGYDLPYADAGKLTAAKKKKLLERFKQYEKGMSSKVDDETASLEREMREQAEREEMARLMEGLESPGDEPDSLFLKFWSVLQGGSSKDAEKWKWEQFRHVVNGLHGLGYRVVHDPRIRSAHGYSGWNGWVFVTTTSSGEKASSIQEKVSQIQEEIDRLKREYAEEHPPSPSLSRELHVP